MATILGDSNDNNNQVNVHIFRHPVTTNHEQLQVGTIKKFTLQNIT